MMNEEKEMLLKLVFDRENDIFFWQYKALSSLNITEEKLLEGLNKLAVYYLIRFDCDKIGIKYVNSIFLTMEGLQYLREAGLISDFERDLRTERMLLGQHEV